MPPRWLVDKILFDIARVPEDTITRLWHSSADPDAIVAITQRGLTLQEAIPLFEEQAASVRRLDRFQKLLLTPPELVIHYISTLCHNRPRQRRNFSKTLWHWCDLSDIASDMASVVAHESVCLLSSTSFLSHFSIVAWPLLTHTNDSYRRDTSSVAFLS